MTEEVEKNEIEEINCGYIAPISEIAGLRPEYWNKLKNIIEEVINDLNIEFEKDKKKINFRMVSDNKESNIIQESIIKSLYYDEITVCNISYNNANVLFELGVRIAFNKPVIIIFDGIEKCPFDISGIRYITYDRNLDYYEIITFKNILKDRIREDLKNKEEINPYLRALANEFFFRITPNEVEVNEAQKIILEKLNKIEKQLVSDKEDSLNNWLGIFSYKDLEEDFNKSTLIQNLLKEDYSKFFKGAREYILLKFPNEEENIKYFSYRIQEYYRLYNKLSEKFRNELAQYNYINFFDKKM